MKQTGKHGMKLETLVAELDLNADTDIANAASKFTDVIRQHALYAQKQANLDAKDQEDKNITELYGHFFTYSLGWAKNERQKYLGKKDMPEGLKLKKSASAALSALQQNIVRFTIAYTDILRCMGVVHAEISRSGAAASGNFKWTADTGSVLKRYQKERRFLMASNDRLRKTLPDIQAGEEHFDRLQQEVENFLGGKSAAEAPIRSVRSNLRMADFAKARKALADIAAQKQAPATIKNSGEAYIAVIEKIQDGLRDSENRLYLNTAEVTAAISGQERDIEHKEKYIAKYHKPYMENKLKSLGLLRDKLLVFGSLEGLLTLYMRLIRGLAQPLEDIRQVRQYESEVIENVNYILNGQFQEIENIERWTIEAMTEFFETMKEFEQVA
jgi:hypothetical protein